MARTADRAEHGSGGEAWHDPREDGVLPDAYIAMGQTAENVATLRGLTRLELDEFGVRSQNLAEKALADGFWQREITPVTTPDGTLVSADDGPRAGVTLEAVSGLKPVFRPDGVVTAGNCCPLNDGAAAVVVMSDTRAAELGLTPLARIVATGVSALSPEIMGLGPVEATRRALAHAGMTIGDIDLVEINEAFAAQVVPSYQDLGIDLDRLNVNGGAIAVGHPFGMTGARLQNTMLNSLDWHDKSTGLITMCVGGGQGMALILERPGLSGDAPGDDGFRSSLARLPHMSEVRGTRWLDADQQGSWRAFVVGMTLLHGPPGRRPAARRSDLSLTEYEILVRLSERPDRQMRMAQLADALAHSRSRVTHTVARMQKAGLVIRSSSPEDGRGIVCRLTDQGYELLAEAAHVHVTGVRDYLVDLVSPEDFAALGRVMNAVSDGLIACHPEMDIRPEQLSRAASPVSRG